LDGKGDMGYINTMGKGRGGKKIEKLKKRENELMANGRDKKKQKEEQSRNNPPNR